MSTIYYCFSSSSAVLGVYCNDCDECCSFAYSWQHTNVAFWTTNKEKILCPECAFGRNDIYRKVYNQNDIPLHRSYFKSNSRSDRNLFNNDTLNKKTYHYRFISSEKEKLELDAPLRIIKCDCKQEDCVDHIDYNKLERAKLYIDNLPICFFFVNEDLNYDRNQLFRKLFMYNYVNELKNDTIEITYQNTQYSMVISEVLIMVGMKYSPWKELKLKSLQTRFIDAIEYLRDSDIKFELTESISKDLTQMCVFVNVLPFLPKFKNEEDLNIRFNLISYDKWCHEQQKLLDSYPTIIDGRIDNKLVEFIKPSPCSCLNDQPDVVKKSKCSHYIRIVFQDRSRVYKWHRVSALYLKKCGYLPYIKHKEPINATKKLIMVEDCELYRLLTNNDNTIHT